MPLHHRMMFNLQSDHFTHRFNSVHFDVDEIMNGTEKIEGYMTILANQLNSNEAFKPSLTFQADLTVIKLLKKAANKIHLGKTSHFRCLTQKHSRSVIPTTFAVHELSVSRNLAAQR